MAKFGHMMRRMGKSCGPQNCPRARPRFRQCMRSTGASTSSFLQQLRPPSWELAKRVCHKETPYRPLRARPRRMWHSRWGGRANKSALISEGDALLLQISPRHLNGRERRSWRWILRVAVQFDHNHAVDFPAIHEIEDCGNIHFALPKGAISKIM